ncbi:MAG: adenylyl-sulfate kinase [Candidatus Parabeggiatoa sp. nov. 3]|nr:MAG: adenylyl-sulfate kinase [Gammaproteobacteria bacterium]RKZ68717.1 MAG: adenylyl-sulfate kinase [Gammaproteobacteria bacterium]
MTTPPKSSNTVWHHATVTRQRRADLNQHQSILLWFTGLSGAGKSTLAHALEERLYQMGYHTFVLDGDNVRQGLCGDLGFSNENRIENIRRVSEMSKLFLEAGVIVLTAFISPFHADRQKARNLVGEDFVEIYCDCPLSVCEDRDVKGLYRRAKAGEIKDFTGISSPYEQPKQAELVVKTGEKSIDECVDQILEYLIERGVYERKSVVTSKP